jgi:hypothetical protein
MSRALMYLTASLAAVTVWGAWTTEDRMTLGVLTDRGLVTVIVRLPDVDERYRWLSVYACSAAMSIDQPASCTGEFERESSFEITATKQHLIHWRDLPSGMLLVTAMAFDADRKVLARGTKPVFR